MKKVYTISVTMMVILLGFPLQAKAEWYPIGDGEAGAIYMNDQSVKINGDARTAEIEYPAFGRALFAINCQSYNYYIQTNVGRDRGYATPGTVAGVVAQEVCTKYNRVNSGY